MLAIVLILLGTGAEIVKVNAWFIIPNFISYILFGLGGIMFLGNIINFFKASRIINKMNKKW